MNRRGKCDFNIQFAFNARGERLCKIEQGLKVKSLRDELEEQKVFW